MCLQWVAVELVEVALQEKVVKKCRQQIELTESRLWLYYIILKPVTPRFCRRSAAAE